MPENLTAEAKVTISAPIARVWDALVNPEVIKRYMFGATVVSDWQIGSPIVWKGEWKGKPFEDKGRILEIQQGKRLRYSHFSPLSGAPDRPETPSRSRSTATMAYPGRSLAGPQPERESARGIAAQLDGRCSMASRRRSRPPPRETSVPTRAISL